MSIGGSRRLAIIAAAAILSDPNFMKKGSSNSSDKKPFLTCKESECAKKAKCLHSPCRQRYT